MSGTPVAHGCTLLCRRFLICRTSLRTRIWSFSTRCRMQFGDTADYKSALHGCAGLALTILLALLFTPSSPAAVLQIQIKPKVSGENLQPASQRYQTSANERFSITRASYLVSDFELQREDGSWLAFSNSVAWMDFDAKRDSIRLE